MKSTFVKALAAGLTLALLVGTAFAGGQKETTTASGSKEVKGYGGVEIVKGADGKPVDCGGIDVVVADWWSPAEAPAPTNAQEEATAEYRTWMQDTYNFKIQQVGIDGWGKHPMTFTNFATNGGDENYVFVLYMSSIASPLKNGLFYDLSSIKCLDFNDPKWSKGVKDLTTKNGKIYGMRGIAAEPKFGLYFNKRLLQEAGIDPETLYDMQAAGTWTWAAYEDMCKKITRDTDNDGVNDVYAMVNFSVNFFTAVVASNEATFIGRDENGKFYNASTSDACLEALNWGNDMIRAYEMPAPEEAKWDWAYAAFRNGEAAMSVCGVYEAGNMKDMADDYGFVCFPKGPKASDYHNVWDDNVYVIPACYDAERAEKIAFAFNQYASDTPGYEGSDGWKSEYYSKFRDTRAVDESIARLRENGVVWYSPLITGWNIGDIVYQLYGGWATPAEQVDKVAPQWQAYIDEANIVK